MKEEKKVEPAAETEKIDAFITLVRRINALNGGMVEYFRQHNYRAMWDVWRSLVDNLAPSPPPTQQEAIPEELLEARKIIEHVKQTGRMDGSYKVYREALAYLEKYPQPSPPFVKTEREEDERPECYDGFCEAREGSLRITLCMHCGGELIQVENAWYHHSSFDSEGNLIEGAQIQDFVSQPSPTVKEEEVPQEILRWINSVHDGRWGFRSGAIVMYHKMEAHKNDLLKMCRSEFQSYKDTKEASLQSQLYNSQKEIKQLRGLLLETMVRMGLDLPCHEDLVDLFNIGMSGRSDLYCAISDLLYDKLEEPARLEPKEFILFNPIPQTPTNE